MCYAIAVFVDTNFLIYAHDLDAGHKHQTARELVRRVWERREVPILSVQVLQEMHENLVRKGASLVDSVDTVKHDLFDEFWAKYIRHQSEGFLVTEVSPLSEAGSTFLNGAG